MSFEKEGAKKLVKDLKEAKIELISMKLIIDKKDDHIYPIPPPFNTPDHYEWLFLSDASIIQEGPGIRKYQYAESGIQFLTVTNITEGSIDFKKSQKYIDFAEYEKKYKHFTLNNGDIVTACSGASWGKSAVFESDSLMMLNTSTLRLRFFKDLGENKYLYYLTKSNYFKANLASHSTGQQANYGYSHYSKIPIPIPSTEEQKEIVEILDQAFESIEKAKANIEKNIENAKELFQSKLNKVFSQSKGWEHKTIGDICNLMTGGTPSRKEKEYFENGTINWLVSGDINKKTINDCEGKITEKGLNNSNAKFLPINSVMIALNGQGKTRGSVAKLKIKATCNQSLVSINPIDDNQILSDYIYSNLNSRYIEIRKMTGDSGNDRRGLNMPLIRSIKISFPKSIEKQKEIIEVIEILDNHIQSLLTSYDEELKNLKELKKSILQKAFSGELTNKSFAA
tara:strand:+ start:1842 stop:3203 length:1362 start_codon:yes stop_codon:yes gene_type:complete